MRQYNRLQAESDKDHPFNYRDMHPVHILVLMQESPPEFKKVSPHYVHTREISYNSGAAVTELENVTYVSLDTFHNVVQNNIDNDLHAWLTFLCNDEPEAILRLVSAYPSFAEIYLEIARFRTKPEEVTRMYSQALLELDHNTEMFMVEQARKEVEAANKRVDNVTKERDAALQEVQRLRALLDEQNKQP